MKRVVFWVVLLTSFAVNGLAVGYIYLHMETPWRVEKLKGVASKDKPGNIKGNENPQPLMASLPEEKQKEFVALRQQTEAPLKEKTAELKQARAEMIAVLKADAFSEEEYNHKLDKVIKIQNDMYRIRVQPFVEITKELTQQERQKFIQALMNRRQAPMRQGEDTKTEQP